MDRLTRVTTAAALLALFIGCAERDHTPVRQGLSNPNQRDSAREALALEREAQRLRSLAERRLHEAAVMAKDPGQNEEAIRNKRRFAEHLLEEADELEQRSNLLWQEVPHGMVQ